MEIGVSFNCDQRYGLVGRVLEILTTMIRVVNDGGRGGVMLVKDYWGMGGVDILILNLREILSSSAHFVSLIFA